MKSFRAYLTEAKQKLTKSEAGALLNFLIDINYPVFWGSGFTMADEEKWDNSYGQASPQLSELPKKVNKNRYTAEDILSAYLGGKWEMKFVGDVKYDKQLSTGPIEWKRDHYILFKNGKPDIQGSVSGKIRWKEFAKRIKTRIPEFYV